MSLEGMRQVRGVDVTIEEPDETVVAGNATVNWPVLATVRAVMQAVGGSEVSGLEATVDWRFYLRYRADVNPRVRLGLVGTTRKFEVISATDPDGRNREMIVAARETV